jgi:hypothetical protein
MNSNFVLLIKRLHDETILVLYSYCFNILLYMYIEQSRKVRRIGVNRASVIIIYPCGPERLIDSVWNACFNNFNNLF